ncbi:MAG: Sir2 family NAD-dependent protein deacetylase [Planctomycetota bacterium]|nr:Sir2 family NAD-dependent protein deacetylase [Planctomycetota bacterium]
MTLDAARRCMSESRNITCFSGAGLSAPSGVGTFRDPSGGWWTKYDPMQMASPAGFHENPELVMDWYAERRRQIGHAEPNAAHFALAACPAIAQVTQNTDNLLHRAGCSDVIQVHGSIWTDRCHARCGHVEPIDLKEPPGLRPCPCGRSSLRPDVVWFGEPLVKEVWERAESACTNCDVLLVVGTSAGVYPAAGLITLARQNGAEILVINTNWSEASGMADIELIGSVDDVLPDLLQPD